MAKVEIIIARPNGDKDRVDVTDKFPMMDKIYLDRIRKATKEGGRGDVIKAIITSTQNNVIELQEIYNNIHNEGGEGHVPEEDYFKHGSDYKEWIKEQVIY